MPKIKLDHVKLSLLLYIFYILTVPHLEALAPYALKITVALLIVLAVLAMRAKAWADVAITLILASAFLLARLKFNVIDPGTYVFRTSAVLALFFLQFTLLIGPWSHFTKYFLHFYKHRRHFGVTTFLLAFTHANFIFNIYFDYSYTNAFQAVFVFFGYTALFLLFWLAITSWDYVQKHVSNRWWRVIHTGVLIIYLAFPFSIFWRTAGDQLLLWQKTLLFLFLGFWLLVAPWSLPRKILKRVNGWKQLHVLVYIVYASVIAHVWTGVVSGLQAWIQSLFWTLVVVVVGSHAVGWVMMIQDFLKRRRSAGAASGQTIAIDGIAYYFLDRTDTFVPGKGRRFDIAGLSLAVYLHEGTFFAMSNICPHQGGPISQGEIVDGFVECPWHRYQFGVSDGLGPVGFQDCIPYYAVLERDGRVYVSFERVRNKDYHCSPRGAYDA